MDHDQITEPTERTMVVAVADVAGFVKACRGKSDRDTFAMLNLFYECVGDAVSVAGGKVVKFMGDSALMVFRGEDASAAVSALKSLGERSATAWTDFDAKCELRIKAHLAPVTCGRIGTREDKRFDIIGQAVNDLFLMPWSELELSEDLRNAVG